MQINNTSTKKKKRMGVFLLPFMFVHLPMTGFQLICELHPTNDVMDIRSDCVVSKMILLCFMNNHLLWGIIIHK